MQFYLGHSAYLSIQSCAVFRNMHPIINGYYGNSEIVEISSLIILFRVVRGTLGDEDQAFATDRPALLELMLQPEEAADGAPVDPAEIRLREG